MTKFDTQFQRQGGRCFWCQFPTPHYLLTRDHLHPRKGGQRARLGGDWVLACRICNEARGALTIGSNRFNRWLRRVLAGNVRRFVRRDKDRRPKPFFHNAS